MVGIDIKSKETSSLQYIAITHHPCSIVYCMCLLKYRIAAQWVATYIRTCTSETHSLAPLQHLIPTLANNIHHDTKVGIKFCRDARECVSFVHVCM